MGKCGGKGYPCDSAALPNTPTKYPALAGLLALPDPRQVCDDLVGLLQQFSHLGFIGVNLTEIGANPAGLLLQPPDRFRFC